MNLLYKSKTKNRVVCVENQFYIKINHHFKIFHLEKDELQSYMCMGIF